MKTYSSRLRLKLGRSLFRSDLNPHLILIENNPSLHCCLKGGTLVFVPNCSRKGGGRVGNRANSNRNLWLAGDCRPARAEPGAGTCRSRSSRGASDPAYCADGAVYIHARVNGNRALLLLDTGAVLTTFSLKLVPTQQTDSRITVTMAKGSIVAFRVSVGFTLGESSVRQEHCSFRQTAIVGDFKFGTADGVIGLDVLSSFESVTFDFKNSVLVLKDK